jgi:hypothetical protein
MIDFAVRMDTTMATKKSKKKVAKKVAKKKAKPVAKKKAKAPKKSAKKSTSPLAKKKVVTPVKKKAPAKKFVERRVRGKADGTEIGSFETRGLGPRSGGQSGDTQGLSGSPETDSESVKELLEEGQAFEAEVVQGVENVPDADQGEVRTHEVPEDDIPEEYLGSDNQK